jgi:DNA-binding XRE family transcriptional regulator|tara:strand:- start:132 stop:332 length:201 start_codon:yes stop_codon:yes gene_type:complete
MNVFRFMNVVFKANRDTHVGDLESNNDEPKLTLASLIAKREQHVDKLIILNVSADIDQIFALIHSK